MSKSDNFPMTQSCTSPPSSPASRNSLPSDTFPITPTTPSLIELLARPHQRVTATTPRAPRSSSSSTVSMTRAEKRQLMVRVFNEALTIAADIDDNSDNGQDAEQENFDTLFPRP